MNGRWDYPEFEPSRPLPAKGGIAARSRRGAIGEEWWSRRFIQLLESFGVGSRLKRGRNYARAGQVIELDVEPGIVIAKVQGSRYTPYKVRIRTKPLSDAQWRRVEKAMSAQALHLAKLLAGEMPHEIEQVFTSCKLALFPTSASELKASCTCPDWENPCKHVAATYYILAEQFRPRPVPHLRLARPRQGRTARASTNSTRWQCHSSGCQSSLGAEDAFDRVAGARAADIILVQRPREHRAGTQAARRSSPRRCAAPTRTDASLPQRTGSRRIARPGLPNARSGSRTRCARSATTRNGRGPLQPRKSTRFEQIAEQSPGRQALLAGSMRESQSAGPSSPSMCQRFTCSDAVGGERYEGSSPTVGCGGPRRSLSGANAQAASPAARRRRARARMQQRAPDPIRDESTARPERPIVPQLFPGDSHKPGRPDFRNRGEQKRSDRRLAVVLVLRSRHAVGAAMDCRFAGEQRWRRGARVSGGRLPDIALCDAL